MKTSNTQALPARLVTLACLAVSLAMTQVALAQDKPPANPQPPAFVDRAGKAIDNTARKVGKGAAKVGEKVGEGAKKAGAAVDRGAKTAGKKVGVDTSKPDSPRKKAEPANAGK